jgi:hypothetical protein
MAFAFEQRETRLVKWPGCKLPTGLKFLLFLSTTLFNR